MPSNFIEEAFVILKSNKKAKKLEKVDKNKNIDLYATKEKRKDYILKEAEMVISNYISNVEKENTMKKERLKMNKKYSRLKKYSYIASLVIFMQAIMLLIK